jgi:hydroxymethylbilane synthase
VTVPRALRIATRGSRLALWQAHAVAERLRAAGVDTDIAVFTTTGDRSQLSRVAGDDSKRQFVKELEDALLRGDADMAVHSAKDLPVDLPGNLAVAACLPREDPRDAIVLPHSTGAVPMDEVLRRLGPAARIGTGSVRRVAQLRTLCPGAAFAPVRGNVDTRLSRLDDGRFDALVLACAGLRRLGFSERISAAIPLDRCVPAPGQGIVAVEIRGDNPGLRNTLGRIHDEAAGRALAAERALVTALGGGCQIPLGAVAEECEGRLDMLAVVASLDGSRSVRGSVRGPLADPEELGRRLAGMLERDGARALLDQVGT